MKSFKQRTLDAQLDLIRRYKENDPPDRCPFCDIYKTENSDYDCKGCFMVSKEGYSGCAKFTSSIISVFMDFLYSRKERLARAKFHIKVRQILLKTPARYFTPTGWKYFNIPNEW
jgi:tryptophanyl-tRNA synthetase